MRIAAALALALAASLVAASEGAPRRVCSVSLAGDELLSLLVEPERVVCVTRFADDTSVSNVAGHYPESIPRITARLEPILAADPDLVLAAPWNSRDFLGLLERSGIRHHVLDDVHDFESLRRQLSEVAVLLGAEERAALALARMDATLARVEDIVSRRQGRPPRVLSFSHLIVAGTGTSVDALIRRAGGANAAAELGIEGHKKVSMERIVALDPDVLLLGFEEGRAPEDLVRAYPHLAATRAMREGRIVILAPRQLTTVTPFLADAALVLARELVRDAAAEDPP